VVADNLLRGLANDGSSTHSVTVDDPKVADQWGLADVNAFDAWDVHTGESGVETKVCVVDSGVDLDHEDLIGNMFVNDAELYGLPGVDDDGNGYIDDVYGWNAVNNTASPDDDAGHGSRCAGILGAMTNNGMGVAGIHWKPTIVPCKFLKANGGGSIAAAVECIDYSIAVKCRVSNHSWGATVPLDAVELAMDHAAEAGQLFVTTAGNFGNSIDDSPNYPGAYTKDNQITVAALDVGGTDLASLSNYSPTLVHIAAPGINVMSTSIDGTYAYDSGTSMAAPFVTGAASLMLSRNPSLTFTDLKNALAMTAGSFNDSNTVVKWGKLNLGEAIKAVPPKTESTPEPVTTLPVFEGRSFIMVPSNLTCQAGCEQHNMFCVDDLTKASDIDLDLCYNGLVASGYGVDTPLTKGGINNSVLAPGGCYAEMYSVVHLNSNSFGFDFGCHGSVVDNPMAQRVCVCL